MCLSRVLAAAEPALELVAMELAVAAPAVAVLAAILLLCMMKSSVGTSEFSLPYLTAATSCAMNTEESTFGLTVEPFQE